MAMNKCKCYLKTEGSEGILQYTRFWLTERVVSTFSSFASSLVGLLKRILNRTTMTCVQALLSFRWVNHSHGKRETESEESDQPPCALGPIRLHRFQVVGHTAKRSNKKEGQRFTSLYYEWKRGALGTKFPKMLSFCSAEETRRWIN